MTAATVWPGVIRQEGVDELVYTDSRAALAVNVETQRLLLDGSETLIDSAGQAFSISLSADGEPGLVPAAVSIGLDEMIALVRAHAACSDSCCVAKFAAASFAEAIRVVGAMREG